MRTLLVLLLVCLGQLPAWAGDCGCGFPHRRATPCERCRPPQRVCVEVPVPQPCPQPERERGGFAAPPRTGETAGESESFGIRGGGLQIPAMNLALPTFQLPSLVRFRRDASMMLDNAQAPFVQETRREFYMEAGPQLEGVLERAPAAPESERSPAPRAPCASPVPSCVDEEIRRLRMREQYLEQRLMHLEQCLQQRAPQGAAPEQRAKPAQTPALRDCLPPAGQCQPQCQPEELPACCPERSAAHAPLMPVQPLPARGPGDPYYASLEQRAAALEQHVIYLARHVEEMQRQRSFEPPAPAPQPQYSEVRLRTPAAPAPAPLPMGNSPGYSDVQRPMAPNQPPCRITGVRAVPELEPQLPQHSPLR